MKTPAIRQHKVRHFALGILAALACALPARAQYVTMAVSNLNQPAGVAVDANNNTYITDSDNNQIVKYVPGGGSLTTLAGSAGNWGASDGSGPGASFADPQGIVFAWGGLIVVDEGSSAIRFVSLTGTVTTLAGQAFNYGYTDDQGTNAQFSFPLGIAVDSSNNLYVADSQNSVIRKIDPNTNVTTFASGFNLPAAVAVDGYNNVWVADTGNNVIYVVSNGTVKVVAGAVGVAGRNDSLIAANARFNSPSGLLWDTANYDLLIADTGNNTIRSLYLTNYNGAIGYAVTTIAGIPGQAGSLNGTLAQAKFNGPVGLSVDPTDLGYYVADSGNGQLRVLQATAPQPPISAPQLGYVSFTLQSQIPAAQFNNITGSSVVFNNSNIIAVMADPTTSTYINYGESGSVITPPGPGSGFNPSIYTASDNGALPSQVPPSIIEPGPDVMLYAISEVAGRPSSPIVSARIQYVTAAPIIHGDDSAALLVTDITTNCEMWYTLDGTTPVPNATNSKGPVTSGTYLSFAIYTNTTFTIKAFCPAFADSSTASTVLTPGNFVADQITFGFPTGEASSAFIASAGQRFYAPVTLTLLSSAETMYTMQFDLTVTNVTGPPIQIPQTFESMLMQLIPGTSPPAYEPIPPDMPVITRIFTNWYTNLQSMMFSNTSINLLGVGWMEMPPATNLYNTMQQCLITYSIAHDTLHMNTDGKVIVGGLSFYVPQKAATGDTYLIDVSNPSATSDGIDTPVMIQTVTNGSLTNGPINSVKVVTVGSIQYLVGDCAPFHWFNAGDFGDGQLNNVDVSQVFQSAIYWNWIPPAGSDFFDVMDSCNGNSDAVFDGDDTTINNMQFGDGILDVGDVYVTYRRSLDPSLTNYARFWSNGVRNAVVVPTTVQPILPAATPAARPMAGAKNSGPRYVTVAADQIQSGGSLTVQVPIRVLAADAVYPIRVTMLNVEIDPLDGSPAITNGLIFSPVSNLGAPALTSSQTVNNYGAAWLDSTVSGVSGTNVIGTLTVTLPHNVNANSAYLVHFDHFSASPNGTAMFRSTAQDGLITVGNRTGSSWHDGIPDTWRLLNFGTVSNELSAADADPDGDGASNWEEYIAGTNPLDGTSVFKFSPSAAPGVSGFALQWSSAVNKLYTLQSAPSLGGPWSTIATNLAGNGQTLSWTDTNAAGNALFYRALVQ